MANPIIYAFTRDDLRKVAHTMFRRFLYKFYSSGINSRCGPVPNGSPAVTKSTRDSSYSSNSTKVAKTLTQLIDILFKKTTLTDDVVKNGHVTKDLSDEKLID